MIKYTLANLIQTVVLYSVTYRVFLFVVFGDSLITAIESLQAEDIATNKAMAHHGAHHLLSHLTGSAAERGVTMLTHCNTGSLATAGYGTALG